MQMIMKMVEVLDPDNEEDKDLERGKAHNGKST